MAMTSAAFIAIRHALQGDAVAKRWWLLALVLIVLSADQCAHFHHYLFELAGEQGSSGWRGWVHEHDELIGWRNEIGVLWGAPLLLASTSLIPGLHDGRLVIAAAILLPSSAASAAVPAGITHIVLAVSYLFTLGYAYWLANKDPGAVYVGPRDGARNITWPLQASTSA
ncbi:MAG: hypothetical protein ACREX4_06420 [Gammaproteobacteria bacterium]